MQLIKNSISLLIFLLPFTTTITGDESVTIPCQNSCGDTLVECLFTLEVPDQRKIFAQFSRAKRKEFLSKLTPPTYAKFLNAYSENDWKKLLTVITIKEKEYWPKTVLEQQQAVRKIKEEAETVRNISLGANLIVSAFFPPAILAEVVGIGYTMVYNIHPIKYEHINKHFKLFLEKQFQLTDV